MYRLEYKQVLPVSLHKAWDFFSSPKNLNEITPPSLQFEILSPEHSIQKMYEGQVIMYNIQPFPLIKLKWVTEITCVRDGQLFIDEQRFGPYKFWHHEHHFKEVSDGVEMTDVLHYELPLGPIGKLVHGISIRKRVEEIFAYRKEKIEKLFGK